MKCFYHPDQAQHAPPTFLLRGQSAPSPEGPVRAELLIDGWRQQWGALHDTAYLKPIGRTHEQ